jgi:hypothetical protein
VLRQAMAIEERDGGFQALRPMPYDLRIRKRSVRHHFGRRDLIRFSPTSSTRIVIGAGYLAPTIWTLAGVRQPWNAGV